MIFASDNWAGASDKVMAALAEAAKTGAPAYGADPLTRSVEQRLAEVFEREVAVFFVATGTAANALGISAFVRPGGVVFAHHEAHIHADEAGAVEFFGGGAKTIALPGVGGKIAPETLSARLADFHEGFVHHGRPDVLSISQITEAGTAYSPAEIAGLAAAARSRQMAVHLDGARFAGAVAALGLPPAELTWKAGVDVLSFGGTKNGCLAAEAVVFFDPARARDFAYARQRAGHGFSKAWFMAAQFDAWLEGGHWLELAGRANAAARRLADAIRASGSAHLAVEPAANEIFAILSAGADQRLRAAGAAYYPWPSAGFPAETAPREGEAMVRLVTSFATSDEEIDRFAVLLAG